MVRMVANIENDKILIYDEKISNKLNLRGYGRLMEEKYTELHPVEAFYLFEEKKIKITEDGNFLESDTLFDRFLAIDGRFEQRYIVYRDLRKRGYKISCFHDLRERGIDYFLKSKRVDQNDIYVVSMDEGEIFSTEELISYINSIDQLIEEMWIAIVDEEGDITYYKIWDLKPKGNLKDIERLRCKGSILKHLVIISNEDVGKELFKHGFYGNLQDGKLTLSLFEALHLISIGALEVFHHDKKVGYEDLLHLARSYQKDFDIRYRVYEDLKNKGLYVKTGYKFGTHFRAYERDPNRYHAEYLIDAVPLSFKSGWPSISRGIRLAHSVRKTYVLAIVDKMEIRYIGMERIKP